MTKRFQKGHIPWNKGKSGEYKRSIEDWLRLCVRCHKAYDMGLAPITKI